MSWFKTPETVEQERIEALATSIRTQRDHLLKDTDWAMLPDSPEPIEELLAYRQALRDITSQDTFPESVVFPELEVSNE